MTLEGKERNFLYIRSGISGKWNIWLLVWSFELHFFLIFLVRSRMYIFMVFYLSKKNFMALLVQISSLQFSRLFVSDSLWPHELEHARPPCPSSSPGVHSDSRPSSQWWHPTISSSVVPFSSCSQSLPASESFLMSQLFSWGGQSIGVVLQSEAVRHVCIHSF